MIIKTSDGYTDLTAITSLFSKMGTEDISKKYKQVISLINKSLETDKCTYADMEVTKYLLLKEMIKRVNEDKLFIKGCLNDTNNDIESIARNFSKHEISVINIRNVLEQIQNYEKKINTVS